jgi:hypothetical protein
MISNDAQLGRNEYYSPSNVSPALMVRAADNLTLVEADGLGKEQLAARLSAGAAAAV